MVVLVQVSLISVFTHITIRKKITNNKKWTKLLDLKQTNSSALPHWCQLSRSRHRPPTWDDEMNNFLENPRKVKYHFFWQLWLVLGGFKLMEINSNLFCRFTYFKMFSFVHVFFLGGSISGEFPCIPKNKSVHKDSFFANHYFSSNKKAASHFCGGFNQVEKYEPTTVHLPENRVETLKNM